ncbi:hypothetical protein [Sandaracinus amylolyticus]|uniref:Co-chaperone DjlA N-terminal domain-containing protein n=1 Tax=Sandaracinus amylolyticus TaxID=927083 RepID=A0A0F6SH05_9BACT|nr:hypothetical protein [Sandaracinus amylolyticus]AKF09604.1 hypothetical protein DB32_006753 [Sandaracinus amylolyticus]
MQLQDLTAEEKLALGGLVRLIVRADGSFSDLEEARIDRIGDELGGRDAFWKVISDSAQAFPDEQGIRTATLKVTRPEARELILGVLAGIAAADTISPSEMGLIDAVRAAWSAGA